MQNKEITIGSFVYFGTTMAQGQIIEMMDLPEIGSKQFKVLFVDGSTVWTNKEYLEDCAKAESSEKNIIIFTLSFIIILFIIISLCKKPI